MSEFLLKAAEQNKMPTQVLSTDVACWGKQMPVVPHKARLNRR